jgi:hypothetical protein
MVVFLARVAIIIAALSCMSCVSQRDRAVVAMNAAAGIADGAHEYIARRYQASLEACLTVRTRPQAEECGRHVNNVYDRAWRGYYVLRAAWLALAAAVTAIDALDEPTPDVDLLAMMVQLGEAVKELQTSVKELSP